MNRLLLTFVFLFTLNLSAQDKEVDFSSLVGGWAIDEVVQGVHYNTVIYKPIPADSRYGIFINADLTYDLRAPRRGRCGNYSTPEKNYSGQLAYDIDLARLEFFADNQPRRKMWDVLWADGDSLAVRVRSGLGD